MADVEAAKPTQIENYSGTNNKTSDTTTGFNFAPGKFGTYCSFLLLVIGIIASIIAYSYSSRIKLSSFTSGCPEGFEDSCRATGGVLRFSFALVITVSLSFIIVSLNNNRIGLILL
jgi:hypothetical protein